MKRNITYRMAIFWVTFALLDCAAASQQLRRSGFLGIVAVPLNDTARQKLAPNETGILVLNIVEGGAAKRLAFNRTTPSLKSTITK